MLAFERPDEPPTFADRTAGPRAEIQVLIDAGTRPRSEQFKNTWQAFKKHLSDRQHRKCGYPYEPDLNVSNHLRFDEHGYIYDCSVRGWESIRTYRLDRIALVDARGEIAGKVARLLDQFEHALMEDDLVALSQALTDLLDYGAAEKRFAGMVRVMVKERTRRDWNTLMALCDAL